MKEKIEHLDVVGLCKKKGLHMTDQRITIANVITNSDDHPSVETIYSRASKKNKKISMATVYRTLKLFEDAKVVIKHDFKLKDDKARYEPVSRWEHNHLIDINSGKVTEFQNPGFEKLSKKISEKLGYKIVGYKLEIFALKEACSKIKNIK